MPSANVDQLQVVNCLRALNFDVMDTSVLKSVRAFEDDVLPAFRRKIDPGDIVVFYFSGHGFSYGPHNFIAPLELPSRVKENDLLDVAIALENVESVIAARRPGIVVVIIDACRTIAGFVVANARNQDEVPKQMEAARQPHHGVNTLVAYASRAGYPATGSERHNQLSVFTESLVRHMTREGLEFGTLMNDIGAEVKVSSGNRQQPGVNDWSDAELYMRPSAAILADDLTLWEVALKSRARERVELYTVRYALSRYAAAARKWLVDNEPGTASRSYSLVSPLAVERAWQPQGERSGIVPAASGFAFRRSVHAGASDAVQALSDVELGLVPSGTAMERLQPTVQGREARAFAAHAEVVTVADSAAKAQPETTASSVARIPAGTLLKVRGFKADRENRVWLKTQLHGTAEDVFVPVRDGPPAAPVELGRSFMEIVALPRKSGIADLIDDASVISAVERAKSDGWKITWVSLATAATEQKEDGAGMRKNC